MTERHARVRVGVTGHRVLADIHRIVAGVRDAVEMIQRTFPGRPLTVVSSLAEGADRIVAEEILRTPSSLLVAILPLAPEDYAQDFGPPGSASQIHFQALLARAVEVHVVPPASVRNEVYRRAGLYIVDHSDVLLAVWDVHPSQGVGGTAEIVERARTLGRPLLIVRAGNRQPGTHEPTTLGSQQGQVLVERF